MRLGSLVRPAAAITLRHSCPCRSFPHRPHARLLVRPSVPPPPPPGLRPDIATGARRKQTGQSITKGPGAGRWSMLRSSRTNRSRSPQKKNKLRGWKYLRISAVSFACVWLAGRCEVVEVAEGGFLYRVYSLISSCLIAGATRTQPVAAESEIESRSFVARVNFPRPSSLHLFAPSLIHKSNRKLN